jgi:hypothetical protein
MGAIVNFRLGLRRLLKRGALLVGANWPIVVIQFAARTAFQVLLAIPIIGTAVVLAVLLGEDLARLLEGGLRDILTAVTGAAQSEPIALAGFAAAFGVSLIAGAAIMAFVKGGTLATLVRADAEVGPLELDPLFLASLSRASRVSLPQLVTGGSVTFKRFLLLGLLQLLLYAVSGVLGMALLAYGYPEADNSLLFVGWALVATITAALFGLWITTVNFFHLLIQVVIAIEDLSVPAAAVRVARFVRAEVRDVSRIFLLLLLMVVAAMAGSALAWSGVALVAFVPLVGLAVVPLQLAALLVRGLAFEFIGLTGLSVYVTLYRRYAGHTARAVEPARLGPRPISAVR